MHYVGKKRLNAKLQISMFNSCKNSFVSDGSVFWAVSVLGKNTHYT